MNTKIILQFYVGIKLEAIIGLFISQMIKIQYRMQFKKSHGDLAR